ncbi:hypothetical protein IPJ70_03425 [Candidatus Campbellbacteria bacterium]|nr:MAG: hypothetical protein IPJ70_03425 [Candidatus Campbellbacteria bacterium]
MLKIDEVEVAERKLKIHDALDEMKEGLSPGSVALLRRLVGRDVTGEYIFSTLEVCVLVGTSPQGLPSFMDLVSEGLFGPVGGGMWSFSGAMFAIARIPRVPVWKEKVSESTLVDQLK